MGYRDVWDETCTLLDSQHSRGEVWPCLLPLALILPSQQLLSLTDPSPQGRPCRGAHPLSSNEIPVFNLQLLKSWDIEFCLHFPHCIPALPLVCSPSLCFSRDPCRQRYSSPKVWQGFGMQAVLRLQRPDAEKKRKKGSLDTFSMSGKAPGAG